MLSKDMGPGAAYCCETNCAWFNVRRGNCAVICISCDIDGIETALREGL
jgi:hypothetical protein